MCKITEIYHFFVLLMAVGEVFVKEQTNHI